MLTNEERRLGIGATDVAAIVGVSTYRAPIDVYREKVGLDDGLVTNDRMRWGQLLQDAVKQGYEEQTGRVLFERVAPLRHKVHGFLYGHPDYYVRGERGLVEVKTSRVGWREDELPAHVRVQCAWYLGLAGREWCDIALLSSTSRLTISRVEHDEELYAALVEAAVRFWRDHVVPRVEPEIDGTEAYRRHLAEKFPRHNDLELVATADQALLVEELRSAQAGAEVAERHVSEIENRIRALMGEAAVLIAPAGRITYKTEAPRTRWQEVAAAIASDAGAAVEEYVARDKADREGPRVLRKHFAKAREEIAA